LGNTGVIERSTIVATSAGLVLSAQFSAPTSWTLSGNYTVLSGLTSIVAVQTLAAFCVDQASSYPAFFTASKALTGSTGDLNSDYSPKQCTAANISFETARYATLTSTVVTRAGSPLPLAVTCGQIVQVTVTIAFS
jgi:hypothetical protein